MFSYLQVVQYFQKREGGLIDRIRAHVERTLSYNYETELLAKFMVCTT